MAKTRDISGFEEEVDSSFEKGNNYLLAIGIDDYEHCPKLHNAVKDAKDLVDLLHTRFQFEKEHIQTLYDADATKRNIFKAFESFAEKITPSDNFIIYFSGHGEYQKIFDIGYWIPVEAEKDAADKFIPNSLIKNILAAIKAHHTFLIVDSCFSGSLFAESASRNISLRKERDPSRWGLTAGRNEIVTDGEKGTNSPFAQSILYQLKNTEAPIGVAELCDKVLEVVSANADQTPRGEPLKVGGHQGGQFVFHLRKNEAADWKEAVEINSLEKYKAYLSKYPDGKNLEIASAKIEEIEAANLWDKIEQSSDSNMGELNKKLSLVNLFVKKYEKQVHYDECLNIGELLEYKRRFFLAKNSEFALRRFLKENIPSVKGAQTVYDEANDLINNFGQVEVPPTPSPVVEPEPDKISKPTTIEKPVAKPPKEKITKETPTEPKPQAIPLSGTTSNPVVEKSGVKNISFKQNILWILPAIVLLISFPYIYQNILTIFFWVLFVITYIYSFINIRKSKSVKKIYELDEERITNNTESNKSFKKRNIVWILLPFILGLFYIFSIDVLGAENTALTLLFSVPVIYMITAYFFSIRSILWSLLSVGTSAIILIYLIAINDNNLMSTEIPLVFGYFFLPAAILSSLILYFKNKK